MVTGRSGAVELSEGREIPPYGRSGFLARRVLLPYLTKRWSLSDGGIFQVFQAGQNQKQKGRADVNNGGGTGTTGWSGDKPEISSDRRDWLFIHVVYSTH
jgi:hypothetical protein